MIDGNGWRSESSRSRRDRSGPSDDTSSRVLEAARRNDADGWTELLKRYERLIYHWCRRAGLDADDADDVLQVVISQVAFSLRRFRKDGRPAAFRRWLRTITERKIADHRRRTLRQPRPVGGTENVARLMCVMAAADGSQADERATNAAMPRAWELLQQIEREVEPQTWDAFWMMTVEGLSSSEAAALMGMTSNAVRLACGRVRRRLREERLFDADGADSRTEA